MAKGEATRIVNLIVAGTDKVLRKMFLDIVADLQGPSPVGTPVDTGWASSNWLPSIGVPINKPVGTRENVQGGASSVGLEGILRWTLVSGLPVFITNNVPYISGLNAGTSKKAPPRFVDKIIASRVAEANRTTLGRGRGF